MTAVLAALLGAVWFLVRAVLILLGVVVLAALLALVCPFCADLDWEGDPEGDTAGTLKIRVGALGLTFPVWQYPAPPQPEGAGGEPAKPGPLKRLFAKLKARFAAWRQKRAAKHPPRKKPAPAKPRQKAKFTLDTLCSMLRGGKKLTLAVFDALRITRIRVVWPVGEGMEPDQAARAYGSAHAWLYSALGVLNRFIYLDFKELRLVPCIQPDTPAPAAQVSFRVSARALFVFIAAVQVLMAFHREKVLDVFL